MGMTDLSDTSMLTDMNDEEDDESPQELTQAEVDAYAREFLFADGYALDPEQYPRLWNISAGFVATATVRAEEPEPPEFVTVPRHQMADLETAGAVARWNMMWEAAQFRRRLGPVKKSV